MTEPACEGIAPDLPEYALGLLPPSDSARIRTHIETCGDCRDEADSLAALGDRLLDLVPDAEAPLGLDRRILAGLPATPRRRWLPVAAAGAALIAAAALLVVLLVPGRGSVPPAPHPVAVSLSATLVAGGRPVGTVRVGGKPEWLYMDVHGLPAATNVSCVLVTRTGATIPEGTFALDGGVGSWGVPSDTPTGDLAGARLVSSSGAVLASATFTNNGGS